MHRGHETLDDTELFVDDGGERGQAVGGARGVGDNVVLLAVRIRIHANHKHGGIILGRGRDDDLLGSSSNVGLGLHAVHKHTSALADVFDASLAPWDVGWILLRSPVDDTAIDDELACGKMRQRGCEMSEEGVLKGDGGFVGAVGVCGVFPPSSELTILGLDFTGKTTVHRVIGELVHCIVYRHERVIDGDDLR